MSETGLPPNTPEPAAQAGPILTLPRGLTPLSANTFSSTLVPQRKIRLPDPPAYYGNSLHEYNTFIRALERRYKLNPGHYATDQIKVVYASSWLRKTVETTWATKEKELERLNQPFSWDNFKEFLHNDLEDIHGGGFAAAIRFEKLKQQPGQSVQQFASRFNEICENLAVDREELLTQLFFAKLQSSVRDRIQDYHNLPTNCNELAALAARIEAIYRIHDKRDNSKQGSFNPRNNHHRDHDSRGTKRPSGGSSSNGQRNLTPAVKLTMEERQRRMDNNLCLFCGEAGHILKDCNKTRKRSRTTDRRIRYRGRRT
ncbi:predicted protein [Histoplasma capsulatum G186AR]|uniref:CCHC-type domain-containing protein n=2 Tax=Ajellomyces capsulatus TaxID=5037 RepID=C0NB85_AJECG|nr:uncharacterized protein HCBG_00381 [Histoplasma capsulatum G186AR]EEH10926.1 predicted protein [Histoplasma capsulatum G186AR]KAG5288795.1 hypothetical protein I7I52_12396 [Histoplasma capsulatum]QSS71372.1 hypothetical protein I7I50_02182 [Histoplasma capsulatum G186AR]